MHRCPPPRPSPTAPLGQALLGIAVSLLLAGCTVGGLPAYFQQQRGARIIGTFAPDSGTHVPVLAYLEPIQPHRAQAERPSRDLDVLRGKIDPAAAIVSPGVPFHFVNKDRIHHRLFAAGDGGFQLTLPPRARSEPAAVSSPGTLRVFCSLHPREESVLLIAPHAYSAAVHDSRFEIADVWPGEYRLHITGDGAWTSRRLRAQPGRITEIHFPAASQ